MDTSEEFSSYAGPVFRAFVEARNRIRHVRETTPDLDPDLDYAIGRAIAAADNCDYYALVSALTDAGTHMLAPSGEVA